MGFSYFESKFVLNKIHHQPQAFKSMFNGAYIHLLLNHIPVFGLFFGMGLLAWGILGKHQILRSAAFLILIGSALITLPVNKSGEEAEEIVEEILDARDPENRSLNHKLIHEHEEAAETAMILMLVLGVLSFGAWVMQSRKHRLAVSTSYLALVLAVANFAWMVYVNKQGGMISHVETRPNFVVPEHDHDHGEAHEHDSSHEEHQKKKGDHSHEEHDYAEDHGDGHKEEGHD